MATASLTTSPTQIDGGASDNVSITNTGATDVTIVRGSQSFTLRPTQTRVIYPEGAAVTAATVSGAGSVSYAATAARTSAAQQYAADPAFTSTYVPQRTPTVVLFGDSRTADCNFSTSPNFYTTNLSWWDWGQARTSGGPVFDVAANSGIGGNTTAQMLARFDTDVTPYAPMAMTLWGGTNDSWATAADVDVSIATMDAVLTKAKAQGIYVFLCTETPTSQAKATTFNPLVIYYNDRLRYLAATRAGVELWDFYSLIVDPTSATGAPLSTMLRDGLHLNALGCSTLATYIAGKLARWPFRLVSLPASPLDSQGVTASSRNVVNTPLMSGTAGTKQAGDSGTVPTNWAATGTPATAFSAPARADGYGNDLQAVITATDGSSKLITNTITASRIIPGATYVLEASIGIDTPQNLYYVTVQAQITVSGTSYFYGWGAQVQGANAGDSLTALANGIIRSRPFTIPAGTVSGASMFLKVVHSAAGTSTVRLGRVAIKRVA